VLDIILERVHILDAKKNGLDILERVSYIYFCFLFHFFLGGEDHVVPFGTVVTRILDMRPEKHNLHFLVDVELLPHAFVNIPDEKMHIGVFLLIFIIYFKFYSNIFIHSFLPMKVQL
jgi:hypothetical protein